MKILQVITRSELGGAQTVVAHLANQLSQEHDVVLVAGEGDGKMWDMLSERVKKEYCPNLQRKISFKKDFSAALELRRLYNKYKPDVIHLHSSKAGTLGRMVFPRAKTVYTVHGFDSVRLAFRKFLPIERSLQYLCKSVVGVSDYDKVNLIAEGIKKNVISISNGIPKHSPADIRDILPLAKNKKIILSIARTVCPKRPDIFVDIARKLPEYEFVWIGNQREMTELSMPENCHFIGNIADAGRYCASVDLFVLPSNYEGLPMVIIEAMSFGKPVVASDVGGVSEIVRNGVNGFVLPNDVDTFKEKIRHILEDEGICKSFGTASYKIYSNELTVDRMVEEYLKIYKM